MNDGCLIEEWERCGLRCRIIRNHRAPIRHKRVRTAVMYGFWALIAMTGVIQIVIALSS